MTQHKKLRNKKKDKAKQKYEKYGKYTNRSIRINQKMTSKTKDNNNLIENNLNKDIPESSNNIDMLFDDIKQMGPLINDDCGPDEHVSEWQRRKAFIKKYSWAVPSKEAILEMVEFIGTDRCVETGAGSGLWSHLLQQCGADVIPTDNKFKDWDHYYSDVETLSDVDALKKYGDRNVLFLCWSTTDPVDQFRGDKIIYIGEEAYGCTAGEPNEDDWELVKKVNIPIWCGLRDYLGFYVRKPKILSKYWLPFGMAFIIFACNIINLL